MDLFALADSDNDSEDETLASHNKNRRRSGHYDKTIILAFSSTSSVTSVAVTNRLQITYLFKFKLQISNQIWYKLRRASTKLRSVLYVPHIGLMNS